MVVKVVMADYEVELARSEDSRAVVDFVTEHFIPHEPINCAIKLVSPGYRMPYFDGWLEDCLRKEDTVTMLARQPHTGEMLGVCIVGLERPGGITSLSPTLEKTGPSYSVCPEKLQKIFQFLDWLKEDLDLPGDYGAEEWGDVMILTCRSDLRTPGLGTELVRRAVQTMQDRGVKVDREVGRIEEIICKYIFLRSSRHLPPATTRPEYSRSSASPHSRNANMKTTKLRGKSSSLHRHHTTALNSS